MLQAEGQPTFVKLAEEWSRGGSILRKAYSYDDVLITPRHSTLETLDEVSTRSELVSGISLEMPIVSANMDSVTEAPMAEFMAKVGGMGIIHRAMSIEQQVAQIRSVKDATNYVVVDPPMIHTSETVGKARAIMQERQRGFVLVVNDEGQLEGLASTRDVSKLASEDAPIQHVMTSRERLLIAPPEISMEEAQRLMYERRVEKLPLVDGDGNVGGVITERDIENLTRYPKATMDEQGRLRVGAAIGVQSEAIDRARALIDAGVDVLVVDVLHGDSKRVHEVVKAVKSLRRTVPVIAGNVATEESTRALIDVGADGVKIGYGPGALCTTQRVTGTGSQQFSAVVESAAEAWKYDIPVNADGGIRGGGDVTKALAAGAKTVMVGTMLAGTDESPGEIRYDDETGDIYKEVRGMASDEAKQVLANARGVSAKNRVAQGTYGKVAYIGSAQRVVDNLVGGLVSGMANTGSRTIEELQMNVVFREQTIAGVEEGKPHIRVSRSRR